jgi:hypothetical protein
MVKRMMFVRFAFILYLGLLGVHSSHHGGIRRPVRPSPLYGELFANFSVDCTIDSSGPSPIVILHYKDLSAIPTVNFILIHACARKMPFLVVHPETHVTVGMAQTQLHLFGIPNQEYVRVSNPQTLSDFTITYQPPPSISSNLCAENQKWSAHVINERYMHVSARFVIGPVC